MGKSALFGASAALALLSHSALAAQEYTPGLKTYGTPYQQAFYMPGGSSFTPPPTADTGIFLNFDVGIVDLSALGLADSKQVTMVFSMMGTHDASSDTQIGTSSQFQAMPMLGQTANITGGISGTVATIASFNKPGTVLQVGEPIQSVGGGTSYGVITSFGTAGPTTPGTVNLSIGGTVTPGTSLVAVGTTGETTSSYHWAPGVTLSWDTSATGMQLNFNDVTGTQPIKFTGVSGHTNIAAGQWNTYVVTFDAASAISAITRNGVNALGASGDGSMAQNLLTNVAVNLSNPAGFGFGNAYFGNNGFGHEAIGIADLMIISGSSYACTGAGTPFPDCLAANTVEPAFQNAIFPSGGVALDWGANCDLNGLISKPGVCMRFRPANPTLNEGSLGDVFTTQVWPNFASPGPGTQKLFPMAYGPGGMPVHVAILRSIPTGVGTATVTANSMTTSAASQPIVSGDLIVIDYVITNSSGSTNFNMLCPSGFSQIGPENDTGNSVNSEVCYKFAGASETGAYAATWDAGGATSKHGWTMLVYANVASVDAHVGVVNAAATAQKTPAGSVTAQPNETVVSIFNHWKASQTTWTPQTTPVAPIIRFRDSLAVPARVIMDDVVAASGSSTQRTLNLGSSDITSAYTLTLVPN